MGLRGVMLCAQGSRNNDNHKTTGGVQGQQKTESGHDKRGQYIPFIATSFGVKIDMILAGVTQWKSACFPIKPSIYAQLTRKSKLFLLYF